MATILVAIILLVIIILGLWFSKTKKGSELSEINFEPYFINSVLSANEDEKYYIFDVIPPFSKIIESNNNNNNSDWYYELHIKTLDFPIRYNDFQSEYIHIEIIDEERLEIWEGEYLYECFTDGPIKYELIELKKVDKASRVHETVIETI